ncbi:ComF family protein [Guggenheimella bovis]
MVKRCLSCKEELFCEHYFCTRCEEKLRDRVSLERIQKGSYFVYPLFFYEDPIKGLIRSMKFHDNRFLSRVFSEYIVTFLTENEIPVDCVSFLPMHPLKRLARGFDQSRDIARNVAETLHVPMVQLCRRVRFTKSLFGLGRKDRHEETKGAFKRLQEPTGLTVVIDDIYTTGSSIQSFYRALGSFSGEVLFITLAKA